MFVKILQCLVIQTIVESKIFVAILFVLTLFFDDQRHPLRQFLTLGKNCTDLAQGIGNEPSILDVMVSVNIGFEVGTDVLVQGCRSGDSRM
jgi:hypothetical protein